MKRPGLVLQFLACDNDRWRVRALLVHDKSDAQLVFTAAGRPV